MGDRVSVTLSVLTSQAQAAKAIIDDSYQDEGMWLDYKLTYFVYEEVNYGNLPELKVLLEHGIAYESEWEAGGDFGKGAEQLRFTSEGEAVVMSVYESEQNPPMNELLAIIDKPEELRNYILKYKEVHTPLPWDNQEEYGKLYRAKKLLNL